MNLQSFEQQNESQFGEAGIIAELLRRHVPERGLCVELGARFAAGNCYALASAGWPVLFVDRDPAHLVKLMRSHGRANVTFCCAPVTAENVNQIVPLATAMLSIDIDGMDYWIWRALDARPAIVAIEFNWIHQPPRRCAVPYDPGWAWDGTDYFGASLAAVVALGNQKGYLFQGADSHQGNAYFVRGDLATEAADEAACWRPANWAHPAGAGPWLDLPPSPA